MDKPLHTFEPYSASTDFWLIFLSTVFFLCLLGIFLIKKTRLDAPRRAVVSMILSFIAVILAGFVGLRVYSSFKLSPVKIYINRIETPYGEANFREVRDFYIKQERKYKPMNPNEVTDSTRYFFLFERSDKTHVLSEGDYLIDSILAKMNEVFDM